MNSLEEKRQALIELSHELGAEHRGLAILGEGNTSTRLDAERFLVKASGSSLGTMGAGDVVACQSAGLLALLDAGEASEQRIEEVLFGSRVDTDARKPSIEALFHAYALSLPGIEFVAHTHPVAINAILCSPRAEEFAQKCIFPDQVVCCGPRSVLVPYCEPGLMLARAIREGVENYRRTEGTLPRVILLQNHGIITLAATVQGVKAAMAMAVKAALIFRGAAALGGPVFLTQLQVESIANRLDEHYRQRALKL